EELEHPFGRSHPRLEQVGHGGELRHRLSELARVLDEGLHVTEADGPVSDTQTAHDRYQGVIEVADEGSSRHYQSRQELRLEACFEQRLVLLLEAGLHLALPAEHLDQCVAREGLLDVSVERARVAPLSHELLA